MRELRNKEIDACTPFTSSRSSNRHRLQAHAIFPVIPNQVWDDGENGLDKQLIDGLPLRHPGSSKCIPFTSSRSSNRHRLQAHAIFPGSQIKFGMTGGGDSTNSPLTASLYAIPAPRSASPLRHPGPSSRDPVLAHAISPGSQIKFGMTGGREGIVQIDH